MPSIGFLKNKKILLAFGLVFLLIVGFFAFKLLSGTGEVKPEPREKRTVERTQLRNRPIRQAQAESQAKKSSPADSLLKVAQADSTKKLPGETPLYQLLKGFRDPFGGGNRRITELEERIKIIKMEIELLKDSLEQERLKEELAKLKKSYAPTPVYVSTPKASAQAKSPEKIIVKAILISENKKSALLYFANKKAWVKIGDLFEGWTVSEINSDRVVLTRDGGSQILGYHPIPVFEGGKDE